MTNSTSTRLMEFDALRGIAAVGVLACHYTSHCHQLGALPFEFRWGSYGPHLFFIISGFVILMTLERCRNRADFVFSRFSRLFPLYWLSVLISSSVLWSTVGHVDPPPSRAVIAVNLTMCQTWLRVPDIEVSYWTLGVELKFYMLMFTLFCVRQLQRVEWFAIGWLLSIVAFRVIDTTIGPVPRVLATPLILDYAHLFVAGLMVYRIHRQGPTWTRWSLVCAAIPMEYWAEGAEATLMVSAFLLLFGLFLAGRLRWIACRWLVFTGSISYALYLIHGSLGSVVMDAILNWTHEPIIAISGASFMSLALATLLTFGFERPCLEILRDWYKGRHSQKSAGGAVPQVARP